MRVFEINLTTNGSTGKIMFGVAEAVEAAGGTVECAAPIVPLNKNYVAPRPFVHIGTFNTRNISNFFATTSGYQGYTAIWATKVLLKKIEQFKPDVVHMHNLHSNFINLPLLFKYLKTHKIKVVWTLHDCWAMTGKCAHFVVANCDKWKTGCYNCSNLCEYPRMILDQTRFMWKKKNELFNGIEDMTLVTPSQWLCNIVKQSYLNKYPVKVINNGIDLETFKPTPSDFRKKYGLENKKIVLGVSFTWTEKKGVDVFVDLAKKLPEDYKIVLVGTTEENEKKLPKNILTIRKTQNQQELAEIYSTADVFANPTREEVLGLVNIEALACGLPIVTFRTGGSPETIDETCGLVVDVDDLDAFMQSIMEVCENKPFTKEACLARAQRYSQTELYKQYVEIFEKAPETLPAEEEMRVFQINLTTNGSTGKIMFGIADEVEHSGNKVKCAAPIVPMNRHVRSDRDFIRIGNYYSRNISNATAIMTGHQGSTAYWATKKLIEEMDKFHPTVLQLHNLHSNFINIKLLFDYIKMKNIRVVWTIHDCWAITGKCAYFTLEQCEKWKTGCHNCTQLMEYPRALLDRTKTLWQEKREYFNGINDMTLVAPSEWIAGLLKNSYLKDYPVKVINNGIDLSVFTPRESDFRKKYGLEDKKIILGVAFGWGKRKGLDVFADLAKKLPEDYKIVLVGTDAKNERQLHNIISIRKTQNQTELAEIYSAADVFVNPTREDNYPTVNMESLACGTPVITFATGGSPEIIDDTCGLSIDVNDNEKLLRAIIDVAENKPFTREACTKKAKNFAQEERYKEYLELYKNGN